MNEPFKELAAELDKESYEWLALNHPKICDALQREVDRGTTPEKVSAFVLRRVGASRIEFARRCESAARHMELVK